MATATGIIELIPNPIVQLIEVYTQAVCEDEPIIDIVYNTIDGARMLN